MKSSTEFVVTRLAALDVQEIMRYTQETWGRQQRNAYYGELKRAARHLQAFPEMGRDVGDGVRELVSRHHVVLYRYDGDTVTVLRVINPRQLRR